MVRCLGCNLTSRARSLPRGLRCFATSTWSLESIVDLKRYPLDTKSGLASVAAEAKRNLDNTGVALFPGFMKRDAVTATAKEINFTLRDKSVFFTHTQHNIFLDDHKSGKDLAPGCDSPLHSSFHRTDVGSVAWDEIGKHSPLRTLYNCDGLLDLVSLSSSSEKHRLADPLGACTVNVFLPKMKHAWHFDESHLTVTIMLQKPKSGGDFEVIPRIRHLLDAGCEETARAVEDVLNGRETDVLPRHMWEFEEGTLAFFRGSESLHRVTLVESGKSLPRLVGVLCFADEPGTVNTVEVRKMFWGREK